MNAYQISLYRFTTGMLAILSLAFVTSAANASDTHPNIVFILVDDMGYGDAGCYNPKSKIPTPSIDSLARDGMRFTDAHASGPLCHISRYGLMTGRYPFRTNVGKWRSEAVIEKDQVTVASLLKSSGYRTAMVGKWHLGFNENGYEHPLPGGPVDVGFDSYFGIRASTDIPPYFYIKGNKAVAPPTEHIEARNTDGWSPIQGEFWRAGGIAPNLALKDVLPRFTDEAIKVIEGQRVAGRRQPLFLYVAYPAPHTPWLPSKEFQGKSGAGMYGDFLMMVDAQIGRILKSLDDHEMRDDTLVIFSSDNGPVWYEHDVQRFDHDSSGGLRGMKADAWECGHRMPFIARWPGKVAANSTSNQMLCFTDMLATYAAIVGKDLKDDAGPDSFNMLPAFLGTQPEDKPIRDWLVVKSGGKHMTIRHGDWKLITGLGSGGFSKPNRVKAGPNDPAGQLYNLGKDIGETNNLYAEHPEIVAKLSAKLQEIQDNPVSRPQ